MEMSPDIKDLADALAKAQAQLGGAKKDGHNPYFGSTYATLASVWDVAREPLTSHGLSVVQGASASGAEVTVTTLLLHTSGQWVRETLTLVGKDHNPQSVGSAISYGRRYQLAALVGIAPEDDDGESAAGRPAPPAREDEPPLDSYDTVQAPPPPAGTPRPAPPAGTVRIVRIDSAPTKTKPELTRYRITLSDGDVVATLKAPLAAQAKQFCEDQTLVFVKTKETPYGKDLVSFRDPTLERDIPF